MNRRTFSLVFLIGTLCILISACAGVGILAGLLLSDQTKENQRQYLLSHATTPEMDIQAKKMVVPADKALIYYYRYGPYRPYYERNYRLYIDNKCVAGSIWPPGFYIWLLPPGVHTFESHESKLVLNAVGSEIYYIRETGNIFSFKLNMEIVERAVGSKQIEESRLLIANATDECGLVGIQSEANKRMKNLTAPEDKGLVYLYSSAVVSDNDVITTVQLDDRPSDEIAAGTYLIWQLTPGTHTVNVQGDTITLYVNAGTTYYIRVEILHRWWGGWHNTLQLVDKEKGRKGVEDSVLMTQTPAR